MIINPQNVSVTAVAIVSKSELDLLFADKYTAAKTVIISVNSVQKSLTKTVQAAGGNGQIAMPYDIIQFVIGWTGVDSRRPEVFGK